MGEIGINCGFILNLTGQKIPFKKIDKTYPLMICEKIGAGTYGDVYKAKCSSNSNVYAVKHYREDTKVIPHEGVTCTTLREIAALQGQGHPNITKIEDLFIDEHKSLTSYINDTYAKWKAKGNGELKGYPFDDHQTHVLAAYEYCPGGDVRKLLQEKKQASLDHPKLWGLSIPEVKHLGFQLLNGISFLHHNKITHRDLKPDNLMLDRSGTKGLLKIGDLGLCRKFYSFSGELTPTVCTIYYRPLEVILGRMNFSNDPQIRNEIGDQNGFAPHYGLGVDIWSAGCIIAEMILGRPLFKGTTEFELMTRITKVLGTPTESDWINCSRMQFYPFKDLSKSHFFPCNDKYQHLNCALDGKMDVLGLDLLSRMLEYNPHNRITAAQALAHPWFSDLNFTLLKSIGVRNWFSETCSSTDQHLRKKTKASSERIKSPILSHLVCIQNEDSHSLNFDLRNISMEQLSMELKKNNNLSDSLTKSEKLENSEIDQIVLPPKNSIITSFQNNCCQKKELPQNNTQIFQLNTKQNLIQPIKTKNIKGKNDHTDEKGENSIIVKFSETNHGLKKSNSSTHLEPINSSEDDHESVTYSTSNHISKHPRTERSVRTTTRAQTVRSHAMKEKKHTKRKEFTS